MRAGSRELGWHVTRLRGEIQFPSVCSLQCTGDSRETRANIPLAHHTRIQVHVLRATLVQGVPQLSIHFVSVILLASTHPNFKSWDSFGKFRKFAT